LLLLSQDFEAGHFKKFEISFRAAATQHGGQVGSLLAGGTGEFVEQASGFLKGKPGAALAGKV